MNSKATSCASLMSLPDDKLTEDDDKIVLTPEAKSEALEILGCNSWKDIEPGKFRYPYTQK